MTALDRPDLGDAIRQRIVAEGHLVLESAAHFGGGERRDVDMALARDARGAPFIPGATVAGCVRGWLAKRLLALNEYNKGLQAEPRTLRMLFGDPVQKDEEGEQSLLAVDDARFDDGWRVARRDNVRIDPATGTASEGSKFDSEVLEPGATATLRMELTLGTRHEADSDEICALFQAALDGLSSGSVRIGAKTRRGLGRVRAENWRIRDYTFTRKKDRLAWLAGAVPEQGIKDRLEVGPLRFEEVPTALLQIDLRVDGSILVRQASSGASVEEPDFVQFKSGGKPTVPGTSWAGVLRARAARIVKTLDASGDLIDRIFGPTQEVRGKRGTGLFASRLTVEEAAIENVESRLQSRIRINRFTGGVSAGALFEEMAEWAEGSDVTPNVSLLLELPHAEPHETALLLLVIKDLWTGGIPVGGEGGIGRGVVLGVEGSLKAPQGEWHWRAQGDPREGKIEFLKGDPSDLEKLFFRESWRSFLEREK